MQYFPRQPATEDPATSNGGIDLCPTKPSTAFDAALPPPGIKRWMPEMKAKVVFAVRGGFLSLGEARERYALSVEEFLLWQRGLDLFGVSGLRVNKQQELRNKPGHSRKPRPEAQRRRSDALVRPQTLYGGQL
jgi:hypothetical protein